MARYGIFAVLVTFACSTLSSAEGLIATSSRCPCYTATEFSTSQPCFIAPTPCIGLPCIVYGSTTTIPGPNTNCPETPTVTSFLPCKTGCPLGCQTATFSRYVTDTCVRTRPHITPSYASDISSLLIPMSFKPTTTKPLPTPSRPCYTKTVTKAKWCLEDDLNCIPPDCIWLSTKLVPSGPVEGCPTTPTVTESRTCKGRCDGACATQWVTATETAWKA